MPNSQPSLYPHKTNTEDIIFQNEHISVFLASDGWEDNQVHLLIIPNQHYTNIYELPDNHLATIAIHSKKCAQLLKEVYHCDGITIRQNNEPAGGQDVFHYHVHIIPRSLNDKFSKVPRTEVPINTRMYYAERLKEYLSINKDYFI